MTHEDYLAARRIGRKEQEAAIRANWTPEQREAVNRRARYNAHSSPTREAALARKRAHYHANKALYMERNRRWLAANAERRLDLELQRKYGVDLGWYKRTLDEQGGVCAMCHRPERAAPGRTAPRLALDHDSETGLIRGLLCGACNRAIGLLSHDPVVLGRGVKYLQHHRRRVARGRARVAVCTRGSIRRHRHEAALAAGRDA